jgi:DNA-binding LytR/AlgR family response regulator
MSFITCIIVEDEPVSQDILKHYIADLPQLKLVAVCNNAIEAGEQLRIHPVDLMFLDITMPKISGLDFYRALSNPPRVIFTTAYPEYAVNGFDLNAVDYLVKPFPFERFLRAVNKYQDLIQASSSAASGFILLQADKKLHRIEHDDILFIEAMGDYVKVHLPGKAIVVHYTLQKLQDELPAEKVFRVHKSYLISQQHIEYIEGNFVVINKVQIPIGQTYRMAFLALLQKRS